MVGYGAGRHLAVLSGRGQRRTRRLTMPRVMLFDLDSRVPNLALMKLSTYYKKRGFEVLLRSEEHTSELQSRSDLVCRLLLEKKKNELIIITNILKRVTSIHLTDKHQVRILVI